MEIKGPVSAKQKKLLDTILTERRKKKWAEIINKKYGEGTVTLELKDQYYNMREKIEPVMHIIDVAFKAMEEPGVKER